nr:MAG TPA: hypothetical protein [Caudoviricetes sp.]
MLRPCFPWNTKENNMCSKSCYRTKNSRYGTFAHHCNEKYRS